MLGLIRRNVNYKSKEVIRGLYNALVRPHLEYCVQAWSPYLKKDIRLLEQVQKNAVRIIPGLKGDNYEDRLREIGLYSLKRRRLRGDLIEVYKMFQGISKVKLDDFFTLDGESRGRGHSKKIFKQGCRLNVRKFSFGFRVVDWWNKLPGDVVVSDSVKVFKRGLDRFLDGLDVV